MAHTDAVELERRDSDIDRAGSEFQRYVMTYVVVSALAVGIWLIQGADGVITVRRGRDVHVGFWPAWPIVIGLILVATRAWQTFAHHDDD